MTKKENLIDGIRPWRVGQAVALAIILLPFNIAGDRDRIVITAGVWLLSLTPFSSSFRLFGAGSIEVLVLIVLPQFIFAFQMVRLYGGKTTGPRAFISWFIGLAIPLMLFLANTLPLLWEPGWPHAFNPTPLPSSLLVAVLLVHFYPPPKETIPWKATEPWWKRA
ncbi:MAG: hypothetical protein JSW61_12305 [Candidatus Thorarchaeota archaeon]|nr:MAG: hypothetical protein JSW61_12305 [Candidatus Thorarchaeota archaeon]